MFTDSKIFWRLLFAVCLTVAISGCKSTSQSSLTAMPTPPPSNPAEAGAKSSKPDSAPKPSNADSRPKDSDIVSEESCAAQSSNAMRHSTGLEAKSHGKLKSKDGRKVNKATAGNCNLKTKNSSDKKPPPVVPGGLENQPSSVTAKTDRERTEVLDSKLTASVTAFQRQLLEENSSMGMEQADGNSPTSHPEDGIEGASEGSSTAANLPGIDNGIDNSSGGGLVPPLPPAQRTGEFQNEKVSITNRPKTLGGGYDEVVARQLREAAETESDPELREKLWNEYKKYTGGADR